MATYKGEERRTFDRVPCKNVLLVCQTSKGLGGLLGKKVGEAKPVPVKNISRTGLCFFSKDQIKPEQPLEMTLELGPHRPTVKASGQVVWCGQGEGRYPYKAGVRFTRLDPPVWQILAEMDEHVVRLRETDPWRFRSQDRAPQPIGHTKKAEETRRTEAIASIFISLDNDQRVTELKSKLGLGQAAEQATARAAITSGEQAAQAVLTRLQQRADTLDPKGDPLAAFLQLEELRDEYTALRPVALSKDGSRAVEQLGLKLEATRNAILSRWNAKAKVAAQLLVMRTRQARRYLEGILARLGPDVVRTLDERSVVLTSEMAALAEQIRTFRSLLESMPNVSPQSLPIWRLLTEAGKTILVPYRRNLFLFKCAVAVTRADGQLGPSERDFLFNIADRVHLSRKEAATIMEETRALPTSAPEFSPDEARDIIHKLYICAMTDGVVSQSELRVLRQLAATWGVPDEAADGLLAEQEQISELMGRARRRLDSVIALTEGRKSEEPQQESAQVCAEIQDLEALIAEVESVAARLPDTKKEDLPGWLLLERAKDTVIAPHKKNLALLNATIALVRADGEVKDAERKRIEEIADAMHMSHAELNLLIANPGEIDWAQLKAMFAEPHELVRRLYELAIVDGSVDDAEKQFFQEAVAKLGLSELEVAGILSTPEEHDKGVAFLDKEGLLRFLDGQRSFPEHVFAIGRVRPEVLTRLKKELRVPEGQQVLLCYENRLTEMAAIEGAALTAARLHLRTPQGQREVISPSLIDNCTTDEKGTHLLLTDGRRFSMSRQAEPFLKLVVECVKANLRKL